MLHVLKEKGLQKLCTAHFAKKNTKAFLSFLSTKRTTSWFYKKAIQLSDPIERPCSFCCEIFTWSFSYYTLYRKFETSIPRNETAGPRFQFLHSCIWEWFIYSHISLIVNLYFPLLRKRTLGSTAGAERRPSCCQAVVGSSSLPSPPLLRLGWEFTQMSNIQISKFENHGS